MRWDKEVIFHLRNLEKNRIAIKNLEDRIAETDGRKFNLKSMRTDDIKVQASSDSTDALLNIIVECEELRKQLREVRFEVRWLENALDNLEQEEYKVLEEFYIKNNKHALNELILSMNYSKSYIYNLRSKSLNKLTTWLYGTY